MTRARIIAELAKHHKLEFCFVSDDGNEYVCLMIDGERFGDWARVET